MTDNTALAQELGPWECFRDDSYYDMWCVRCVHDRTFGHGFHLVQGDEAAALRDLLNTYTPAPALDEVRELVKAAYIDGATAVHNSWVAGTNGREPDFGEAASDYTAFAVERLASQPTAQPSDLVERVAKALAKADGLDFDEVCGVDANPDDGYCDSGTCVAAFYEDHDADHARGVYMRHARAAIAAMQGGDAVNVAQAWNSWWNNISTGANDKHMQTAFEAGFAAAIRGGE